MATLNRYTKEAAVTNIRDYYIPLPHESALGKQQQAFERARSDYIAALQGQIKVAEQISFVDVFPKSAAANQ